MHAQSLVHCDLKPDNIMFTAKGESGVPKIIDFDFTLSQEGRQDHMRLHLTETVSRRSGPEFFGGTALYFPPEILEAIENRTLRSERLTSAVDVHCLGKTMHQLLMGTLAPTAKGPSSNLPSEHCTVLQQLFAEMTQQPERRSEMGRVLDVLRTVYSALNAEPGEKRLVVARPLQTKTGALHTDPQTTTTEMLDPLAVCMNCRAKSGAQSRFLTCGNGHSHCSACWLKSTGEWIVEMESEYVDAIPCPVQQQCLKAVEMPERNGCSATFPLVDHCRANAARTESATVVAELLLSLDGERENRLFRVMIAFSLLSSLSFPIMRRFFPFLLFSAVLILRIPFFFPPLV